jgi:hypothetical protein
MANIFGKYFNRSFIKHFCLPCSTGQLQINVHGLVKNMIKT